MTSFYTTLAVPNPTFDLFVKWTPTPYLIEFSVIEIRTAEDT